MIFLNFVSKRLRIFFIKSMHWEYWPTGLLYFPVLPYLLYLWWKTGSFFFFNAANPGIKNGGFLMESKWEIDRDAPKGFFPRTMLVKPQESYGLVQERVVENFPFPFFAKPEIGGKGVGVALINNTSDFRAYHAASAFPYLVQQRVNYPLEAGIFYVRLPGAPAGIITGIVEKLFVQVTGDGQSTIEELINRNPRYMLQFDSLKNILEPGLLSTVLAHGQHETLSEIGNHARGSQFINAKPRITPALTKMIDELCQSFSGFYFGRLDIRFRSWEEMENREHFAVIELNGAGSGPTHIYDPANSIWYVWKEICRHWRWMARISRYNHQDGVAYLSFYEGVKMFRQHFKYSKKMKGFNFEPCKIKQAEPSGIEAAESLKQPALFHDP